MDNLNKPKIERKHVVAIVVLAFLAVLVWRIALIVVGQGGPSQRYERAAVAVEVDSVRYEPIEEILELTGTVHPLYQYTVASKVSGRVVRINKRIGDKVNRGETIARIDADEYEQAVLEAEADLRIAQATLVEAESQLDLSKEELERVQYMQAKGIASEAELQTATAKHGSMRARVDLARAQIEQRQAALASARIRLDYTVLSATEPGFIGERFVDEGTLATANSGIASVVGIDKVIVRTTVIERVYGRLKVGQTAEVATDAFPGETFSGSVARIAPKLDEASRVAQMEVEVPNDSLRLKPGMFCKVRVALASKDSAQIVARQALVARNGSSGLFVVGTGESVAHYVQVQVGITTLDRVEIVSPEIHGVVVSLGQHLLQDGSAVNLPADRAVDGAQGGRAGSSQ